MKQILAGLCAFCLLLTGCASTRSLSPPPDAGGKTWVVVSTMGNKARFQHIGTMVFNNVVVEVDTTGWGLDKYIEAGIEKRAPGLKWVHVDIPQDTRDDLASVGDTTMIGEMFESGKREKSVKSLHTLCSCDFAIIVAPYFEEDRITGTNASLKGYGVHQRGILFKDNAAWTFIDFAVTLVDLRTGKDTGEVATFKTDRLPFSLDKEKNLAITPDQMKQVEDSIKMMTDSGLDVSVRTLPDH
jgi:hypothetical protein